MTSVIGIVTAGHSNLGSLLGSLSRLGAQSLVVKSPKDLEQVDKVILPGVGSFSVAMSTLAALGLVGPLRDFSHRGSPILGICLGMQLLCEAGTEGGSSEGLNLVHGTVARLGAHQGIRVPHVGWNSIDIAMEHPLLSGIESGADFYFVHSFAVGNAPSTEVLSLTHHGENFVSGVAHRNVVGFQFHPEKSQKNGEKILSNFLGWDGSC